MEEEEIILIPKPRAAALCASALKRLTAKAAKYAHLRQVNRRFGRAKVN